MSQEGKELFIELCYRLMASFTKRPSSPRNGCVVAQPPFYYFFVNTNKCNSFRFLGFPGSYSGDCWSLRPQKKKRAKGHKIDIMCHPKTTTTKRSIMNDRIFILFFAHLDQPAVIDLQQSEEQQQHVLQHTLDKSGNLHLATAVVFF